MKKHLRPFYIFLTIISPLRMFLSFLWLTTFVVVHTDVEPTHHLREACDFGMLLHVGTRGQNSLNIISNQPRGLLSKFLLRSLQQKKKKLLQYTNELESGI